MNPILSTSQQHKQNKKAPLTQKKLFFEDFSFRKVTEPKWVKTQFELSQIKIKATDTILMSPQKLQINEQRKRIETTNRFVKSVFDHLDMMQLSMEVEDSSKQKQYRSPISLPESPQYKQPVKSYRTLPKNKPTTSQTNNRLKTIVNYKQLD